MLLKKISYTILLLSIIRIGNFIPLVGINQAYLYDSLTCWKTFAYEKKHILDIFGEY